MKKIVALILAVMLLCLVGTTLAETDLPKQTITIICPYGAGGGTDLILRALAQQVLSR